MCQMHLFTAFLVQRQRLRLLSVGKRHSACFAERVHLFTLELYVGTQILAWVGGEHVLGIWLWLCLEAQSLSPA